MNKQQLKLAQGILFTDMYQLTMAQLYFHAGIHECTAQFDHFFRQYPDYGEHQAGYCINAGMDWLLDWMSQVRFEEEDLECLRSEKQADGTPTFSEDFLEYLRKHGDFSGLTIHAIGEGRVVHPNVPLTVVEGPLAMAQILETALLNTLNFQTLIATKASRIRHSTGSSMLMEFGLRRAHGMGGNEGCRAAVIGGCDYTSNTGLSYAMGLDPKGTHSHAMVQTYLALGKTELDAFRAYAQLYPDNCLLLIDTIDSLGSGLPNAIKVFDELRQAGHEPIGVRLDSGDLAYLSIQVSKALNDAGYPNASIVLSNDLDELTIWQIHSQIRDDARRNKIDPEHLINRLSYGVGTRLITSDGQSALGGVYKLVALKKDDEWVPAIKLSNSIAKVPNPGHKRAWRIYDKRNRATADLIGLAHENPDAEKRLVLHHPTEKGVFRSLMRKNVSRVEPLHQMVWDQGRKVNPNPSLEAMRAARDADLEALDSGVLRLRNPHVYHVSLTPELLHTKVALIEKFREGVQNEHDNGQAAE